LISLILIKLINLVFFQQIFRSAWIAQALLLQAQPFPQALAGQFKTTLAGLFLNMAPFQVLIR